MLATVLVGCGGSGNNDTQTPPAASSTVTPAPAPAPSQPAAVGTVLDAPEKAFDSSIEHIYIHFNTEDAEMELALSQITPDTYVLYVTDGVLKLHEMVYECSDSGIKLYWKDAFMSAFELDTESSQATLQQQHDSTMEFFAMLTLFDGSLNGLQYRKVSDSDFAVTGNVYVYDLLENGEYAGKIKIDKATGLLVDYEDANGESIIYVHEIRTSDLGIPQYK